MSHPASCTDPDCQLPYVEHLRSIGIAATAMPTRCREADRQRIRTKRWERDMPAYKRLRNQGYQPPQIDGSALREREGQTAYDIEHRPVTIDWNSTT